MLAEGKFGEQRSTQGALPSIRFGPYGAQVSQEAHGRMLEAARLGKLFTTMIKAVTIASTHNTPISAVTATPVLGILNPSTSGKAMSLQRVALLTTSGTPAGGQAVLNVITGVGTTITATVTGSIFSHLVDSSTPSPQGSKMKPYNNVALTGLAPTAANEVLLIGGAAAAAATGTSGSGVAGEDVGGMIIVPPNTLIALMAGTAAGTSWIVNASLTWEEMDWPLS